MSGIPTFEARQVSKSFADVPILLNVSINASVGQIVCLVGPNGAGKSTLLSVLSGRFPPDQGCVLLDGKEVTHDGSARMRRAGVSIALQRPLLITSLTVGQHLWLALIAPKYAWANMTQWRVRPSEEEAIKSALQLLGIRAGIHSPVTALDHGDRKLLEIACAVVNRPRVLLLDEPAAGLSSEYIYRIGSAIADLSKRTAIVIVEHRGEMLSLLARAGASGICLARGEIISGPDPLDTCLNQASVMSALGGQSERES